MSKPDVTFNIKGYIDRRTLDLHQRHDVIEEARWRWRVERRAAQSRRTVSMVSRLGEVGPSRQGDAGGIESGSVGEPDSRDSSANSHSTWTLLSVRNVQRGWTSVRRLLES